MKYSRQEFEKELRRLLLEYNNWLRQGERTDLQINSTRDTYNYKIRSLIGAIGEEKIVISGDFIIANVHGPTIGNYLELELKPFGYYRYSSKYYRKKAEELNRGDKINITAIASGHYSNMESDNIRWLLDDSARYLNDTETKGPLIVNLIDIKDSKDCYIATVCYQNINAEEVKILRQFRDEVLSNYYLGKLFIRAYYFISPTLAKYLAKSSALTHFIRNRVLNPLIFWIQQNAL